MYIYIYSCLRVDAIHFLFYIYVYTYIIRENHSYLVYGNADNSYIIYFWKNIWQLKNCKTKYMVLLIQCPNHWSVTPGIILHTYIKYYNNLTTPLTSLFLF